MWVFMATNFEEVFGELLKEIRLSLSSRERDAVLVAQENGLSNREIAKLLALGILQRLVGYRAKVNGI